MNEKEGKNAVGEANSKQKYGLNSNTGICFSIYYPGCSNLLFRSILHRLSYGPK